MSDPEDEFAFQCLALKLPTPRRQFPFHPERKFRADFAWPEYRLLLEVQGGAFAGGRHTRGAGFQEDCERRCLAVGIGYSVLEVTPGQVTSGRAAQWTRVALNARGWQDGTENGGLHAP